MNLTPDTKLTVVHFSHNAEPDMANAIETTWEYVAANDEGNNAQIAADLQASGVCYLNLGAGGCCRIAL